MGRCRSTAPPQAALWLLRIFATCMLSAFALGPAAAGAQVLLVLSDESAGYQAVADEMRAALKEVRSGRLRIDTITAQRLDRDSATTLRDYELVATVGLAAAQASVARAKDLPVVPRILCLLIPRQGFERLQAEGRQERAGRLSAVFIDQPLSRQFDLLRLALPDRTRVGVILGPASQALAGELGVAASAHALTLATARIGERGELYGALQKVLPASDLLLMLPDPIVANADTVYGLLLTTYREQLPVIGFSEGLLNAGALISLYSTARQQGRQGGEIARGVLAGDAPLPEPVYPKYFSVRVNATVARSLGLHVPAEDTLADALNAHRAMDGASAPAAPVQAGDGR